jgi:cysteine desulfurase
VELTGHATERLPNSLSIVVPHLAGHDMVIALDLMDIACSTGSACSSGSTEPSHVLSAMGYPPAEARGALRLSVGRTTSDADIDRVLEVLPGAIERLRAGRARLETDDGAGEPAA